MLLIEIKDFFINIFDRERVYSLEEEIRRSRINQIWTIVFLIVVVFFCIFSLVVDKLGEPVIHPIIYFIDPHACVLNGEDWIQVNQFSQGEEVNICGRLQTNLSRGVQNLQLSIFQLIGNEFIGVATIEQYPYDMKNSNVLIDYNFEPGLYKISAIWGRSIIFNVQIEIQ